MQKLHILNNPNVVTDENNTMDPFNIATIKFIKHMSRRGYELIHYGLDGSKVDCDLVNISISKNPSSSIGAEMGMKTNEAIKKRKSKEDLILCFHGVDNLPAIKDHTDLKIIEPSIGYAVDGVFAPYRVFVSYANMHLYYGYKKQWITPSWFDAVIHNPISPQDFTFTKEKDDYFLCFGRVIVNKGIDVAIQVTEKLGKRLVIAGPGDLRHLGYKKIPPHVEVVGLCDKKQRNDLMRNAKGLIAPTYYVEPFGNMVVESLMCGTPVITSDWGGFAETNNHGKTGFRCSQFKDFVNAVQNISTISPEYCRSWAVENFSDDVIHDKFDLYLKKVINNNFYAL